jgi:UV DNA damage endonuclease
MPSGLLPWLDAPPGELREWADAAFAEVAPDLRAVGEEFCRGPALRLDDAPGEQPIRVTSHPDQFCVLNSERPDVVQSSIRMLAAEARVMDAMGLERSPWVGINVHGGARDRLAELRAAVNALPDAVRSRLTLENCERAYSVPDLCAVGVPVVFDPHHEVVRSGCGLDSEHLVAHADLAMATWPDPCPPLAHLSNGLTGPRDRRHNDFISHVFPSHASAHLINRAQ